MTTYIVKTHIATTKKEFKALVRNKLLDTVILHDPSIIPGSRSGTIPQLFKWGIRHFTVTDEKRRWFAEVSQGPKGQPVIK